MSRGTPRRAALLALVAAVAGVHLWLAGAVLEARIGDGAADTRPHRIRVAFVRELAPQVPPPPVRRAPARAAAVALAAPPRAAASAAPTAASAPVGAASAAASAASAASAALAALEPAASAPTPASAVPVVAAASAAAPVASAASAPSAVASAPPESAAIAASAPAADLPFEWPPSTRLEYTLVGNYRGRVEGQAQVEWLREGTHYQVRLDLSVGPFFAPLLSRSVWSDGEIGARGLRPQRYDEETRIAFGQAHRTSIVFDGARIRLPDGRLVDQPEGVQDSASQFVQLTWLFTSRPELLARGHSIAIPLALPRQIQAWIYDVQDHETLYTPFGAVDTVHVKPRAEPVPGVSMTAELWIAPSFQYLPLRILIHQSPDTFVDLLASKLPLQALPQDR